MMDLPQLAATVAPFILSHLDYIRGKVADSALSEAGKALVGTLKDQWLATRDSAKAAVEDVAQNPDDADNREALLIDLKKALKADPEWAAEVERLASTAGVHFTITGDHNKAAVIQGNQNKVSIS